MPGAGNRRKALTKIWSLVELERKEKMPTAQRAKEARHAVPKGRVGRPCCTGAPPFVVVLPAVRRHRAPGDARKEVEVRALNNYCQSWYGVMTHYYALGRFGMLLHCASPTNDQNEHPPFGCAALSGCLFSDPLDASRGVRDNGEGRGEGDEAKHQIVMKGYWDHVTTYALRQHIPINAALGGVHRTADGRC